MIRAALLFTGALCLAVSGHARAQGTMTATVSLIGLPQPTISSAPAAPEIASNAAPGTSVASYAATMPDGSPFPGTVTFGPPYFDAGGLFALTGAASGKIIVSPTGPGLASLPVLPITEHITLQAVSPP